MFKRANRVSRLEKALIIGFMAGYRDNPRPNPENVVTIKLNESTVRWTGLLTLFFFLQISESSRMVRRLEIRNKRQ